MVGCDQPCDVLIFCIERFISTALFQTISISNMTPLKIMITIIPMLLVVSNTQNVDPYSNFFAIHSKVANPQAPQTFQIGYWRLTNKKGHQIRNFTPSEKKTALAIILLNLLAGLLYRGLILKNIIKTGSLTPCNIMTGILRALNGLKSYWSRPLMNYALFKTALFTHK